MSWTTRISRIDGNVGLDQGKIIACIACFRGNDARRNRIFKSERGTDRKHPFTYFDVGRIAGFQDREILAFDFQQGHICPFVRTDDFRLEFAVVCQSDKNFIGIVDDVMVRENIAIGSNDEP